MKFSFTNIPHFVSPEDYQDVIDRQVGRLKKVEGLKAIYQIGGINTPGISDIDFLVVFEENVKLSKNFVTEISSEDRYLFTHNLFGTTVKFLEQLEQFTFFGKYILLSGDDLKPMHYQLELAQEKQLKKQIAFEYLIKAYISICIEKCYSTIKLRNLFLYAKALLIDLSFFEIESGKLAEVLNEIIQVRENWFKKKPSLSELSNLVEEYYNSLLGQLNILLKSENFYLAEKYNHKISRHIRLMHGDQVHFMRNGIVFSRFVTKISPYLFNLQNKFNNFIFVLPIQRELIPASIAQRHEYIGSMVKYNQNYLPHFIPTAYGLNIFSPYA